MNNMTFHCKLILDNDQDCQCTVDCFVTHVMNHVYHDHNGDPLADQNRVRVYILSKFLRNYVEELADIGNEYSYRNQMTNELVLGAIQEIHFMEIAEDLIRDYSPKSPDEVAESEEFFNVMCFGNYDIDED